MGVQWCAVSNNQRARQYFHFFGHNSTDRCRSDEPADDYAPAHLPGAVNLPLRELDERHAAVLDRTRPVVVYCWDTL